MASAYLTLHHTNRPQPGRQKAKQQLREFAKVHLADRVKLMQARNEHLDALKGALAGCFAVDVEENFRVVLRFGEGRAMEV